MRTKYVTLEDVIGHKLRENNSDEIIQKRADFALMEFIASARNARERAQDITYGIARGGRVHWEVQDLTTISEPYGA